MSDRTLFTKLPLLGKGTGQVQSLSSYIEHLAFAHNLRPRQLALLLAEACPEVTTKRALCMVSRDASLYRGTDATRTFREALERATGAELKQSTLEELTKAVSTRNLSSNNRLSRYCPECVKAVEGIPYARLLWELQLVKACPIHKVRLRAGNVCGAAASEHLPKYNRPSMQGVCTQCGSVGFRCIPAAAEAASDEEVWIAAEVEKLLMAQCDAQFDFGEDTLKAGIFDVVEKVYEGSVVRAATQAGMSRSVVCMWMKFGVQPALPWVLRLCFHAGADLVSVFRGKYVQSTGGAVQGTVIDIPRKYQRSPMSLGELAPIVLAAARQPKPLSLPALCRKYNMHPDNVRRGLPAESRLLTQAYMAALRQEESRNFQECVAAYQRAADQLAVAKKAINLRSLQEQAELPTYRSRSPRARAIRQVLAVRRPDLVGMEVPRSPSGAVEVIMAGLKSRRVEGR